VPRDLIQAHAYYGLAASRCSGAEADGRERFEHARANLAAQMTAQQVADAERFQRSYKIVKPVQGRTESLAPLSARL